MADAIDAVDWAAEMEEEGLGSPELFSYENFDPAWLTRKCRQAVDVIDVKCPDARQNIIDGVIPASLYIQVVCEMVMRVCRYTRLKTESNGTYSYTNESPMAAPPSFESSPDLFVSSRQEALLQPPLVSQMFGTVGLDGDRIFMR